MYERDTHIYLRKTLMENRDRWSYSLPAVMTDDTYCDTRYVYNEATPWEPPRPVCLFGPGMAVGYGVQARMGSLYRQASRGPKPPRDRLGLLPPKPMLFRKLTLESPIANVAEFSFKSASAYGIDCVSMRNGSAGKAPSPTFASVIDTATSWGYRTPPREIVNACLSGMYNKIANRRSRTFDAVVFYGERKETFRMLKGRTDQLLTVYRAVRNGNFTQAKKFLLEYGEPKGYVPKVPSNKRLKNLAYRFHTSTPSQRLRLAERTWLEFRYGWLPFLGEMSNLIDDIAGEKSPETFVVRHRVTKDEMRHAGFNADFGLKYPLKGTCSVIVKDSHFYRLSAAFRVIRNSTGVDLVSQLEGLGILNPFSAAWELTPLSFVVDWFVNVGDVLDSITTTAGLGTLYVCESYKFTSSTASGSAKLLTPASSVWNNPARGTLTGRISSVDLKEEFVYFHRKNIGSLPKPTLQWQPSLGWKRVVDSLALIGQFTSRAVSKNLRSI